MASHGAKWRTRSTSEAFRIIDTATDDFDLDAVVAPYGCEGDFKATTPIIEKYGLTFG